MPANEETDQQQEMISERDSVEDTTRKLQRSSILCLSDEERAEDSDEGCAMDNPTECNYSSLLSRDNHEKFIRDAVELIIKEAVFGVSLLSYGRNFTKNTYIFL